MTALLIISQNAIELTWIALEHSVKDNPIFLLSLPEPVCSDNSTKSVGMYTKSINPCLVNKCQITYIYYLKI